MSFKSESQCYSKPKSPKVFNFLMIFKTKNFTEILIKQKN